MRIHALAAAALAAPLSFSILAADAPPVKVSAVKLHDCGETGAAAQKGTPRILLKPGVRFGCKITMQGSPKGGIAEFRAVMFRPDEMKVAATRSTRSVPRAATWASRSRPPRSFRVRGASRST